MTRLTLLALSALALSACPNVPVVCTAEARVSVEVSVLDPEGEPIEDAEVWYRVVGSQNLSPCEQWGEVWACGYEMEGELEIFADAWGFGESSTRVTVEADECHVATESVELTLDEVECTMEMVPSVVVEVVDEGGDWVQDAVVEYVPADADVFAPIECEAHAERWVCGWEEAGELTISVTSRTHSSWSGTVEVGLDECHVITEELLVSLETWD